MPQRFYANIVLMTLALFLLSTTAATAQETVALVIFRDTDSLTIFVPGEQPVSLEGLRLEASVTSDRVSSFLLSDYPSFRGLRFNAVPTPICFRLEREGGNVTVPFECPALTLIQPVPNANVFWYDDVLNQSLLVRLTRSGSNVDVFCPPGPRCDVTYVPPATIPDPPSVEPSTTILQALAQANIAADSGSVAAQLDNIVVDLSNADNRVRWERFNGQYTNFVLGATVRWGPGATEDECGFLLRYVDNDNFYSVRINQESTLRFVAQVNDEWQPSRPANGVSLRTGGGNSNELMLVATGNVFSLFINGLFVGQFQDSVFNSGEVGLLAATFDESNTTNCTYSNAWVWELTDSGAGADFDLPEPQVTSTVNANVRSGDGLAFDVIGTLSVGNSARILGISAGGSGWYQIQMADGRTGWISSTVVTTSGDTGNIPFVPSPPTPTAPPPTPTVPPPTATPVPERPDLIVVAIGSKTCVRDHRDNAQADQYMRHDIIIRNIGGGSTGAFGTFSNRITLVFAGRRYSVEEWASRYNGVIGTLDLDISNLGPNQDANIRLQIDLRGLSRPTYTIEVIANSGSNTIPETNTTNNILVEDFSTSC